VEVHQLDQTGSRQIDLYGLSLAGVAALQVWPQILAPGKFQDVAMNHFVFGSDGIRHLIEHIVQCCTAAMPDYPGKSTGGDPIG